MVEPLILDIVTKVHTIAVGNTYYPLVIKLKPYNNDQLELILRRTGSSASMMTQMSSDFCWSSHRALHIDNAYDLHHFYSRMLGTWIKNSVSERWQFFC